MTYVKKEWIVVSSSFDIKELVKRIQNILISENKIKKKISEKYQCFNILNWIPFTSLFEYSVKINCLNSLHCDTKKLLDILPSDKYSVNIEKNGHRNIVSHVFIHALYDIRLADRAKNEFTKITYAIKNLLKLISGFYPSDLPIPSIIICIEVRKKLETDDKLSSSFIDYIKSTFVQEIEYESLLMKNSYIRIFHIETDSVSSNHAFKDINKYHIIFN